MLGDPILVQPRLGQGTFRTLIADTYQRRCAVTGERALPALDAAHIRSVQSGGRHLVNNGLLLRSDVHRLFDAGYVTVTPDDHRFRVSSRLKTGLHPQRSRLPQVAAHRIARSRRGGRRRS
jgi:putative restriction endonuclease